MTSLPPKAILRSQIPMIRSVNDDGVVQQIIATQGVEQFANAVVKEVNGRIVCCKASPQFVLREFRQVEIVHDEAIMRMYAFRISIGKRRLRGRPTTSSMPMPTVSAVIFRRLLIRPSDWWRPD